MSSHTHTLSPRDLAVAIGVSESSVKRWIDAGDVSAMRTSGGHRRVSRREAVRFIRAHGLPLVAPTVLGLALPALVTPEILTAEMLVVALTAEDAAAAEALLIQAYISGASLPVLFDGPVREAMQQVGELWYGDDAGIVFEHRATDVLIQTIHHIRSLQPLPDKHAPRALGGAGADDPYILPSLMASTVFSEAGYRTTNLGPHTPARVLIEACHRLSPDLLWLSVSVASEATIEEIRKLVAAVTPRVLTLGGRGLEALGDFDIPGIEVLDSMENLDAFARRHVRAQA